MIKNIRYALLILTILLISKNAFADLDLNEVEFGMSIEKVRKKMPLIDIDRFGCRIYAFEEVKTTEKNERMFVCDGLAINDKPCQYSFAFENNKLIRININITALGEAEHKRILQLLEEECGPAHITQNELYDFHLFDNNTTGLINTKEKKHTAFVMSSKPLPTNINK